MVDWEGLKRWVLKWIVGEKFVRDFLESKLEEGVSFALAETVRAGVIRNKTAGKIYNYVKDKEVVKEFLVWYLEGE